MNVRRILYPTDFSRCSELAFAFAAELARCFDAQLHLLHVVVSSDDLPIDPMFYVSAPGEAYDQAERAAVSALEGLALSPAAEGVEVVVATRRATDPAPAILEYARNVGVELVVMGTHGRRGAVRLLLGSQAEEVLRHATFPVLTVREDENDATVAREVPPREILVPFDFAPASLLALEDAAELARRCGARLRLLHVSDELSVRDADQRALTPAEFSARQERLCRLESRLEDALAFAAKGLPSYVEVRSGRPAEEILRASQEPEVDLIVMATRGVTGIKRVLFGSTAEEVLRLASAPVLVVQRNGEPAKPRQREAAVERKPARVAPSPMPGPVPVPAQGGPRVEDVMQHEPVVATPGMTLDQVGQRMAVVDCGFLPVVDEAGKVVGVLTDRDVCLALTGRNRRPIEVEVRQVMTGSVAYCRAEDPLSAALALMAERKVRRLPVLDPADRIVGILSVDDVLVEARHDGEVGHPSYEEVASTLQTICRHAILAVR